GPERGIKHRVTVLPAQPGQFVVRIFCTKTRTVPTPDNVHEFRYPVIAWRVPLACINPDSPGAAGDPEPVFFGCYEIKSPGDQYAYDMWWLELPDGKLRALSYPAYATLGPELEYALKCGREWWAKTWGAHLQNL